MNEQHHAQSTHQPTRSESTEQPITVLIVDDNEQWARFVGSNLESEHNNLSVTTVVSANEALLQLHEDDSIDCVLADYRMPEIDGLQLLERVREERPDLPFIIITGQGTEGVAAQAINAGVTDYLQKDPKTDQTPLFATRIKQAVDQYRLRRAIRESEQRYRTVVEQTQDAILILHQDQIIFHNDQSATLLGASPAELVGADFIQRFVHPESQDRVRNLIDNPHGTADGDLLEIRLTPDNEAERYCEITASDITYANNQAVLFSLRDVTNRIIRDQRHRRERELNSAVQRILVESRTREEIETAITSTLSDFGYDLVWTGQAIESDIHPNAINGNADYVEGLDLTLAEDGHGGEPSHWVARTGESRYVSNIADLFPTDWREHALSHGYRSVGAVPLAYDDVSYGFVALYHAEPNWFNDAERDLIEDIGETIAFAIHHVQARKALGAPSSVEAELALTDTDYYLFDILGEAITPDTGELTVTVDGTHPYQGETFMQYITPEGCSPETFREALHDHPAVIDITQITDTDPQRYKVTVNQQPPESALAAIGAVIQSTTVTPTRVRLAIELASRDQLGTAITTLKDRHGAVSVLSCVDQDISSDSRNTQRVLDIGSLTEKQLTALKAALHHGYFEQPRVNSAVDIAESLDLAHSTFLQHLRIAQQKLFKELFQ